jgi:hypothetical protein
LVPSILAIAQNCSFSSSSSSVFQEASLKKSDESSTHLGTSQICIANASSGEFFEATTTAGTTTLRW